MNNIVTIWKKELKDAIRDKRTLMAMIIMPMLLMPVIIIGMGKFMEMQIKQAEEQKVVIGIENQEAAPVLVHFIDQQEKIEVENIKGDLTRLVKSKDIDAGLIIPEDFQSQEDDSRSVQLVIVQNSLNDRSGQALSRLSIAASNYNNQLLEDRLANENVSPDILAGVYFDQEEVATEQELGGFGLGFLLPLFIVMWSIIGGQYIAVDISAGEKERKTLESLLLTPARRIEIVFGKFLAVATSALVAVIISLTSMYIAVTQFGFMDMKESAGGADTRMVGVSNNPFGAGADFGIEPQALLIMLGVSVLMVLMFSAIILSIAIFAKSYKEAQSYIGPSYLVVILPVVLFNSIPGLESAQWMFALPAVNSVILFKEILIGTYDIGHILLTIFSLAIYSAVTIYIAGRIYQKEGVLFKD